MLPTTEAVIKLFDRADGKGGRLLAMEGTQAHPVGTALAQLHMATHDVDNVNACQQFLDE